MPERRAATVPPELAGERVDAAVARVWPDLSRARVQRLIEAAKLTVNGRAPKSSAKLKGGEALVIEVPEPEPTSLVAQDLPLSVIYEDADLVVIDKAAGMVVHPGKGAPHSTLANALAHRFGTWFGLVHRLDKETSGCIAVARTEAALAGLQAQFKGRTVEKTYLALCHGTLAPEGRLDTPYGRHPSARTKFTSRVASARRAVTAWTVRESFAGATFAEVTLHTGRTHQIRVHFAESGHPLLADATYGGVKREAKLPPESPVRRAAEAIGRQALHAWRLSFAHPRTGKPMRLEAKVPGDFEAALAILRQSGE